MIALARLARVDIAWVGPPADSADFDAARRPDRRAGRADAAPALQSGARPREADRHDRRNLPGRESRSEPVPDLRHRGARKNAADVEATHLRGSRKGQGDAGRRLGNGEGAQQRHAATPPTPRSAHCSAPSSSGSMRCSTTIPTASTRARNDPEGDRRRRSARRGEVSDQGEPVGDHHHTQACRSAWRSTVTRHPIALVALVTLAVPLAAQRRRRRRRSPRAGR